MDHVLLEPLPRFIAQLIAIVLLSRLLGRVARRVGQPMVVAEIVAGILLGPSLLGLVAPDLATALFAKESLVLLDVVSSLGLVLFMFLIGLELDPKLIRSRRQTTLAISQATFLVPLLLGVVLALHLYPRWAGEGVSLATFALFVGATMSVTAFPVLARIIAERGLLRSRVGTLTIASAAIDDVIAWCVLAFVVASLRASGLGAAATTTGLAVLYVCVMLFVVRPLLARLANAVGRGVLSNDRIAAVMLLLFASSWATELIGIHALFGAFLFGVIMPRDSDLAHALSEKLGDIVIVVLLPLFFAYSGVRTQIGLLDSAAMWGTCGLVVVVACASKLGAATLAARLGGMSWRESGAIGALMNTRGFMVLIVLNVGLDFGILEPALFSMFVVMALITTFLTKPLLEAVYPPSQHARDLLAGEGMDVATRTDRDARYTVLACLATEDDAPALYALARAVSGKGNGARVQALALRSPDAAVAWHDANGTSEPRPMSFPSTDPARDICRIADVKAADLVLLARRARHGGLLGATSRRVMAECKSAVGLLVSHGELDARDVLILESGTRHDAAARVVAERLRAAGARVVVGSSRDAPFAQLGLRKFDLVIAGVPEDPDAAVLAHDWEVHHGNDVALLLVRGAVHEEANAA